MGLKGVLLLAMGCSTCPCTSIFKPFILGRMNYNLDQFEGGIFFEKESLWWRHEQLHSLVLKYYSLLSLHEKERARLVRKIRTKFHV